MLAFRRTDGVVGGIDPSLLRSALDALERMHGAWYMNEQVIGQCGMLGRSEGCLAVADSSLPEIM
jgi:hypothetical protein